MGNKIFSMDNKAEFQDKDNDNSEQKNESPGDMMVKEEFHVADRPVLVSDPVDWKNHQARVHGYPESLNKNEGERIAASPSPQKDKSQQEEEETQKSIRRGYALMAMSKLDQKKDKSEQEKEEHPTNFEDIRKKFEPNRKKNGIGSSRYYSYEHEQKRDDFAKKIDKHGQEKDKSKNEQEEEDLPKSFRDMLNKFEQSTKITVDLIEERDDILKKIGDFVKKNEGPPKTDKKEQKNGIPQGKNDNYKQEEGGPERTLDILLEKIDALQNKIDKNMPGKGELQKTLGALQNKIDDLQKKLDKNEQEKREIQQTLGAPREKLEELQKKNEELRKEIERRKAQFKSAWNNTPLFPDWRKEEFQAVDVFLDAATAHPALLLSENGRRVTWGERRLDLPSSPQRFDTLPCVLGEISITSGRCFWEVEVESTGSWDLGVCRNDVTRNGMVMMSPQNGFWAIRLYNEEYWALTPLETPLSLREKPHTVGIFLDYEAGDVSFYNMTDGSHIFSFPQITFSGGVNPLFRLWSSESGPLTIVQAN